MKKLFALLFASVGLLMFVSGCNSGPAATGFEVHLEQIVLSSNGTAKAKLKFANGSVAALNIIRSSHKVFLNGKLAGTIALNSAIGLPPQYSENREAEIKWTGGAPAAGSASYRMETVCTLSLIGDSTRNDPTATSGTVEIVAK